MATPDAASVDLARIWESARQESEARDRFREQQRAGFEARQKALLGGTPKTDLISAAGPAQAGAAGAGQATASSNPAADKLKVQLDDFYSKAMSDVDRFKSSLARMDHPTLAKMSARNKSYQSRPRQGTRPRRSAPALTFFPQIRSI